MKTVLSLLSLFALPLMLGCATLSSNAGTALDATVVAVEGDAAAEKIRALDLSVSERLVAETGLEELEALGERLTSVQSATDVLYTVATAREQLDSIAGSYGIVRQAYGSYLARTGQEPDLQLEAFDVRAVRLYDEVLVGLREIDSNASERASRNRELTLFLLRGVALFAG